MAIHFQINADKSINENGYRNFVKNQMATQPFQKAAADDIITKCIEELKKPDPAKPDELASGCSKNAMRAFKCAARGLFNSCPADMQDSSEKCTKMREMINSDKMDKFAEGVMEKRDIKWVSICQNLSQIMWIQVTSEPFPYSGCLFCMFSNCYTF